MSLDKGLKMKVKILLTLALGMFLAGCMTAVEKRREEIQLKYLSESDLLEQNYAAADQLLTQFEGRLDRSLPILVTTIVDIDDLYASSTLGRISSEQIAARFTAAGYKVIEMKFGDSIYMKRNQGELVLTREIIHVAKQNDAQAVVVGSYGVSQLQVFFNAKLVKPDDENAVLGSVNYPVYRNQEVDKM